jgi:hypothetical protein
MRRDRVNAVFRACVIFTVLAFAPAGGAASEAVARVAGAEITRSELAAEEDETARAASFRDWVWKRVYAHYVLERGLSATAAEISEVRAYDREFERRDRAQRARKLAELTERLAREDLDPGERAWLEEFRSVLIRVAEHDAGSDRAGPDAAGERALLSSWIEFWKGNRALYAEYGGAVEVTTAGPAAHGARVALLADYERRGLVQLFDRRLRDRLFELLSRPPRRVVPPDEIDFTPYWRRPIPPSYFPD